MNYFPPPHKILVFLPGIFTYETVDVFALEDAPVVNPLRHVSPLKSFLKPAGLDNQAKDQLVSVGEADFVGGALLLSKIGEEAGGREGGREGGGRFFFLCLGGTAWGGESSPFYRFGNGLPLKTCSRLKALPGILIFSV